MTRTSISDKELSVLQDKEFLNVKAAALSKIELLLSETHSELKIVSKGVDLPYPPKDSFKTAKISKGEHYLGFPYRMLDYPAVFSRSNTFAFRTMFWWGNFFSATLHLEGASLDFYRKNIYDGANLLYNDDIYISVGDTPWQYHYENDNYQLLSRHTAELMKSHPFVKLSKKINTDDWESLPTFSANLYLKLLKILAK